MRTGLLGVLITALITVPTSIANAQELSWIAVNSESSIKSEIIDDGYYLFVDGQIEKNVRQRVEQEFKNGPPGSSSCSEHPVLEAPDGAPSCRIRFNSPGGSLVDGLDLGSWIHENYIGTTIGSSDICLSACAWPFLAGSFRAVVGSRGRDASLHEGGLLGFHGFSFGSNAQAQADEIVTIASTLNGQIYEYVLKLGNIDIEWVAQALTVPPKKMYFVTSPHDFDSLNLEIPYDIYSAIYPHAGRDACLNALGRFSDRIIGQKKISLLSFKELVKAILLDRIPDESYREAERLFDKHAIQDLLWSGGLGYFSEQSPVSQTKIFDLFKLERGYGFYNDYCVYAGEKTVIIGSYEIGSGFSRAIHDAYPWRKRYPFTDVCERYRGDLRCMNLEWAPGSDDYSYNYSPWRNSDAATLARINAAELRSIFINYDADVRAYLQRTLRNLGLYSSSIDGKWGKGTEGAFQKLFDTMDEFYPDLKWRQDFGFDDGEIDANEFGDFWNAAVGCGEDKMLRITDLCQ